MSSKPFTATVDGGPFLWHPSDGIEAAPNVQAALDRRLAIGGVVALTPTGPFVDLDEGGPVAVVAALLDLGAEVALGTDAPDLGLAIPEDAVA